jgi:hypothetical protein
MAPKVPERTSSAGESSKTSNKINKETRLSLEIKRNEFQNKAKAMRQALKPQASFNSAYWFENAEIALVSKRSIELQKEISKQNHLEQGAEGKFSQSEKAIRLREQLRALEAAERLLRDQAERLSTETTCEDLPLPLAYVGDKKAKRFHFSEIIGRLPYVRATVTLPAEK